MSTNSLHEPAKILRFPRKMPTTPSERRNAVHEAAACSAPHYPAVDFGSAWYHVAALEEERARK